MNSRPSVHSIGENECCSVERDWSSAYLGTPSFLWLSLHQEKRHTTTTTTYYWRWEKRTVTLDLWTKN